MSSELLYQIALTRVPGIGDVHAKLLINRYGKASAVFKAPKKQLEALEGIGSTRAYAIKNYRDLGECEKEITFITQHAIKPLFITDHAYPQRLLNCYDSPALLYYKGNADLNAERIVSIVGTRNHSDYGRNFCENLVGELQEENILIVSGLAFGIDTIAHRSALKNDLRTVGVLAHGLDKIYPPENKSLALQMKEHGGLLTDFTSGCKPDKQNFPKRNRIVAGICDALVVVESSKKGGSLITAELADSYNRDVFAVPGRTTDLRSEGCNYLIKSNKALLLTSAGDLLDMMNWKQQPALPKTVQRQLFIELTKEEKAILDILRPDPGTHIDALYFKTGLSSSAVAAALLTLEMQGIITSLPGKHYKLL